VRDGGKRKIGKRNEKRGKKKEFLEI